MLSRKDRLSKKEFNRFFQMGKRQHTSFFQLISAPSAHFHASIVVPKSVAKKAVDRNRIRRRLYAIVRRCALVHDMKRTFIFITKNTALKEPSASLAEEVERSMIRSSQHNVTP